MPEVKRQIVDMALNGSGIRDTARVLGVSPMTVMTTLKKSTGASPGEPYFCYCRERITTRGGDP
jgi:transposase-like protein